MADMEENFLWGAATSAYQIEGAADADGKGASIWDTFTQTGGAILDHTTGATACDHYHRFQQDIDLMAQLGLQTYRFSVSWPRILPQGKGKVNPKGLDFYSRLIDALLHHNITPHLSLYHWDLPEALEQAGGWFNRDTCARFADYAAIVAKHLGDRVRFFSTINEPATIMTHGYITGRHAPGKKAVWKALHVGHHLLLAHGLGLRSIRAANPSAKVGLVNCFNPVYSQNGRPMLDHGWIHGAVNRLFMDPIFAGHYPAPWHQILKLQVGRKFQDDLEHITRPMDFLGVNYYTPIMLPRLFAKKTPARTAMRWPIYPQGLHDLLTWMTSRYPLPDLYVTENGAAFDDQCTQGKVEDTARTEYLQSHIEALLQARREGAPVKGYYVWSLLDNFEWAYGFTKRFGLLYVDYASQQRMFKQSALWYRDFIRQTRGAVQ